MGKNPCLVEKTEAATVCVHRLKLGLFQSVFRTHNSLFVPSLQLSTTTQRLSYRLKEWCWWAANQWKSASSLTFTQMFRVGRSRAVYPTFTATVINSAASITVYNQISTHIYARQCGSGVLPKDRTPEDGSEYKINKWVGERSNLTFLWLTHLSRTSSL